MNGALTVGTAIAQFVDFVATVVFTWVPATVSAVVQVGTGSTATGAPLEKITTPVSIPDIIAYLKGLPTVGTYYGEIFTAWSLFAGIAIFVGLVFIAFLIYIAVRLEQVRALERKRFESFSHTVAARDVPKTQLRWDRILQQISSDDEQNWRLAILEGDIMLNELLDVLGYRGETMADKMRQVERGSFNTIDIAWEAHRVRNRVAHEGTHLSLNQREAQRVVGLYEQIFREFKFIS